MSKIVYFGIVGLVLISGWIFMNNSGSFAVNTADFSQIVEGNNRFVVDLYNSLKGKEGNLFFSPYSISTALAMTYSGSRGKTEEEMARILRFGQNREEVQAGFAALIRSINAVGKDGSNKLSVANALWGERQYRFLEPYMSVVKKYYEAGIYKVDYVTGSEAARLRINEWVEDKTNKKIKDLIKPGVLTPTTRLVLTNAIYFKGKWKTQFKEEDTREMPFKLSSGKSKKSPLMNQTGDFNYAENESLKILEMPYVGDELSMIIFLPGEKVGLSRLEGMFTYENINNWLSVLRQEEVVVSFPRFKMTSEFLLGKTLEGMGMSDAFSPDRADFSGMTGNKDLFIDQVVHKAFVEVNEEGTEAAAATGVVMKLTSMPSPKKYFLADHPFIYFIRDTSTGSILFIGRVTDPS